MLHGAAGEDVYMAWRKEQKHLGTFDEHVETQVQRITNKNNEKRTDDFAPEARYSGNIFVTPSSLDLQYCTQQVISSRETDVSACGRYLEVLNGAWKRDRTIKGSLVVAE